MTIAIVLMSIMFLVYTYLVFALMDTILENPRLKPMYRIPVGILNMCIGGFLVAISIQTTFSTYVVMGALLLVEFIVFYRDNAARCLFCMLASVIHVMALRSLCVSAFSVGLGITIYEVIADPYRLVVSTAATFFLLNVAICLIVKVVPAKQIRMVMQHTNLLWFMIAWMGVFCGYLLMNSKVYSSINNHPTLLENQIYAPISILIGSYIVLVFSFKTGELLGYREKSEELQLAVERERQYRSSIDKDVFRVIEVNFNQNYLVSGFEDYESTLGEDIHHYGNMLLFMVENTVHPEDRGSFLRYLSPLTVVEKYLNGTTEIAFEYRRLMPEGHYVWMRVLMALMKDAETGDVKGFVQIKDIDGEKKLQLDLQYKAERDLLTGLYNKGAVEAFIVERLESYKERDAVGVMFIIDIDNFKTINDRLGHLYGDAVLSELSERLGKIFRKEDIVGRIGGDEFLVFAEGLTSEKMIAHRAQQICEAFLRTYANDKKEAYTVSGSIGIAIFPENGQTYEVLFQCADIALYQAKANGKNGYCIFNGNVDHDYISTRTEIDSHGTVPKSFKENRVEYAFRLLYGSEDTKVAIESVLELIAETFGFSRANIFKFNENSTHFNGVFEWCGVGIPSVSELYVDMPVRSFDFVVSALEESGGMFYAVPEDFPDFARGSYTSIHIKSIVHFSIKEQNNLMGVIAFQNCTEEQFEITDAAFEELRTICQVLSVFMAKRLSNEREQRHHDAIEAVVDNMNSISYVIDRDTYEVFYENHNASDITGISAVGMLCYEIYRGRTAPCVDCPMQYLSKDKTRITMELYTQKYDIYTKTSAALIDWSNDRKAMLISSVDVSEYKMKK